MSGRKLVITFAAAGAVTIGTLLWVGGGVNGMVKAGIERYGGRITETDVRLAGVDLKLRKGRGTLRGLRVKNPSGFSNGDALALGEITLDIDEGSLTKEPIVIEEIRITGPELLLEIAENGGINLRSLRDTVEGYVPQTKSGRGGDRPPRRVAVRRITVDGGKIKLDATAVGGEKTERELGSFTLNDVGGADGVPADEMGQELLRVILARSMEQGALDELKRAANDLLNGLGGLLK